MVSQALANALAAGRPQFNARVADMHRRQAQFDAASFSAFVRDALDPLAVAVEEIDPARTTSVVAAAFDIALELVAQGMAGTSARLPWVNAAWRELAPHHAGLLAREPAEVLGALTNAVLHLSGVPGVRMAQWLQLMAGWAPHAEGVPALRALGQIAAWRAGMAHFREGALQAAEVLPEAVALAAFEAPAGRAWAQVRDALTADPWWDEAAQAVREDGVDVGSFLGFGGIFPQPPQVRVAGAGFAVRSGNRHAYLVADASGAVLLPAAAEEYDVAASGDRDPRVSLDGARLRIGMRDIALDLPADGLALACGPRTVAVVSPYTHSIGLWPLPA